MTTPAAMSRVIFCGNLPLDTRQREVEDLFRKYGCVASEVPETCALLARLVGSQFCLHCSALAVLEHITNGPDVGSDCRRHLGEKQRSGAA